MFLEIEMTEMKQKHDDLVGNKWHRTDVFRPTDTHSEAQQQ